MKRFFGFLVLVTVLFAVAVQAANVRGWSHWLRQFRQQALSQGIPAKTFDRLFYGMTPDPRVLRLDRQQPEHRLTYRQYQRSRVNNQRIRLGRQMLRKHASLLQPIARRYGVSACMITSLWGMESAYGRFRGHFPVVRSLATLAWGSRRRDFFRQELLAALKMIAGGHVSVKQLQGEWAGASGHPQFLPTSWYKYAIDHNGDGKRDIWSSLGDVFASIANYLHQKGWQRGQPVLLEVHAPRRLIRAQKGWDHRQSLRQWEARGVSVLPGQKMPSASTQAWLIAPDGGPVWLVLTNFRVLMTWNRSIYYAGTVNHLAQKICQR